ncbi:Flp family type IVb pilin [Verrucomicrobia bacterium LW23]|nr:Flp family type IVb pilin [Verrucomicrobia bacterium LW23]
MTKSFSKFLSLRRKSNKSGQTLVEYALILAFISVVAILVLQQLGGEITKVFGTIKGKLQEAQAASV